MRARASPRWAACSYPSTLRSDHGRQTLVRDAHCPASAKTRCPWPAGMGLRLLVIAATSCLWIVAQAFILGGSHALPPPPSPTPGSGPSLSPAQTIRTVESPAEACQVSDLLSVVSAPTKAVAECRKKWGVLGMGPLICRFRPPWPGVGTARLHPRPSMLICRKVGSTLLNPGR